MIDLDLIMGTPESIRKTIGQNAKKKRKYLGYTQEKLAEMSGMSLASYRRFEQTGHIALSSLIMVAIALDSIDELTALFAKRAPRTMEELLKDEERKER